jgi:hypothetical protein
VFEPKQTTGAQTSKRHHTENMADEFHRARSLPRNLKQCNGRAAADKR